MKQTADQVLSRSQRDIRQRRMLGNSYDGKRERDDFYPTPPEATEALLAVEKFFPVIWEPACGDGAISKVLEQHDYSVLSTDLVDRGYGKHGVDFLFETQECADDIITNPPFKLAVPFVYKALELVPKNGRNGKVAFLCRINFLEGIERGKMFSTTPLARVWVFSKRITFNRGGVKSHGGGMLAFAWFIWEHNHKGPPTLGWI